ncbi:discoidin domain-containing protein [Luteolibacter yonseiensis]|uniref:Discoidin domain-containing protein n=1 Tax=Luteolibacter yonseiensis TaxID=1144680 RepID=A0A934R896_9BACT|nr:sialate O-acetylesterase [Luteolibacter yonseiensis]MBK1818132.1 discoidin domain-containing protein [Luteolibacter yonseiensis]
MFTSKTQWLVVLLVAQSATAEITLAPLFQDGGVLQRDKPVPVWGRASAGKSVSVTFGGQTKTTTADAGGRWQVSLDPMTANAESRTMGVTEQGLPPVEVKDLLVGEVWLGSGQSNMEFIIKRTRKEDQDEAASGPVPGMRIFSVPKVVNSVRQETVKAKWEPATPENAADFSAVAYLFGKKLAEELKVPIGMIHSSWGGSRIEPWWAEEGLEGIPELEKTRNERLARSPGFPEYDKPYRNYITAVRSWADEAAKALDNSLPAPEMPKAPELLKLGSGSEVGTYQAMIHPLVPYALRGFLWYQGESNNGEGMAYTAKMQALIAGWRKQFKAADAPFLFVQLAPFNYDGNRANGLPEIWWAQQEVLKIPHTGMAVTNDIGNIRDIHPTNKGDIARRLALWALADTYGKKDIVKSGPLFSQYKAVDGGIAIAFDHTGGGLATRDGKSPTLFEIAGIDGDYKPADAKISADGKTILLTSSAVAKPDRARFAWSQSAEPNLINKEGLPAGAFNTHWPNDPTLGHKVSVGKPHQSSHPNTHNWDSGLTDGTWGNESSTCYATSESPDFPKTVTVDLGSVQPIHVINYGTPDVGATKTVAVSVSEDGKNFTEVGRNEFPRKKARTAQARFAAKQVRYVRATFIDSHPKQDQYSETFGFLSELEAYTP